MYLKNGVTKTNLLRGEKAMLYNCIKEHYKETEPIFFWDLERGYHNLL